MPAGYSWAQYLRFFVAAMLSMAAGAQTVHMYYKPLNDLDLYISRQLDEAKTSKENETKS